MGSRSEKFTGTVYGCVEGAQAATEELVSELQEYIDGANDGQQAGELYARYEQCVSYLEDITWPDEDELPEEMCQLSVEYTQDTRKGISRSARLANIQAMMQAAAEAAGALVESTDAPSEEMEDAVCSLSNCLDELQGASL